jgi:hypothetical protein
MANYIESLPSRPHLDTPQQLPITKMAIGSTPAKICVGDLVPELEKLPQPLARIEGQYARFAANRRSPPGRASGQRDRPTRRRGLGNLGVKRLSEIGGVCSPTRFEHFR